MPVVLSPQPIAPSRVARTCFPPLRPFVKWAGGKTVLLPALRQFVPESYKSYFEPFVGGGAFFFDLQPTHAILADSNQELINCYRIVKERPEALFEAVTRMQISESNFYAVRKTDPLMLPDLDRAARFLYLNKTCFNGLYRVNRYGKFNTPYGHYKQARIAELGHLKLASAALSKAEVLNCNYRELLMSRPRAGDFVYLDPPYHPVSEYSDFKRYTKEQFRHRDHVELADVFRVLDKRGCFLVLSNSHQPEMIRLYDQFRIMTVAAPRFINCKGNGRGPIREIIVSNF
jgi:DNA adenine methylase